VRHQEVDDSLHVHGVGIARITQVSSTSIEPSLTDVKMISVCHSWLPPNSESTSYLNGSTTFSAFLETIACGELEELWGAFSVDYPSLKELKLYFSTLTRSICQKFGWAWES
jgi:hypothetical protein